ncbi:MAG: hypothetical protein LRY43_00470 [Gammaproteobacteria bacterium]|nr:hypothetical protein [Gammaproteobacteria bacterium]
MLDEVDAPLDDANVIRFSELVREMSTAVQFIVITHNKVTMESLNQLMGVTMNEPGVSRIVSVDIKEAVELGSGGVIYATYTISFISGGGGYPYGSHFFLR